MCIFSGGSSEVSNFLLIFSLNTDFGKRFVLAKWLINVGFFYLSMKFRFFIANPLKSGKSYVDYYMKDYFGLLSLSNKGS